MRPSRARARKFEPIMYDLTAEVADEACPKCGRSLDLGRLYPAQPDPLHPTLRTLDLRCEGCGWSKRVENTCPRCGSCLGSYVGRRACLSCHWQALVSVCPRCVRVIGGIAPSLRTSCPYCGWAFSPSRPVFAERELRRLAHLALRAHAETTDGSVGAKVRKVLLWRTRLALRLGIPPRPSPPQGIVVGPARHDDVGELGREIPSLERQPRRRAPKASARERIMRGELF